LSWRASITMQSIPEADISRSDVSYGEKRRGGGQPRPDVSGVSGNVLEFLDQLRPGPALAGLRLLGRAGPHRPQLGLEDFGQAGDPGQTLADLGVVDIRKQFHIVSLRVRPVGAGRAATIGGVIAYERVLRSAERGPPGSARWPRV